MLSSNQIAIILRAAAALRSPQKHDGAARNTIANELTDMVISAETIKASAAASRAAKGKDGSRGAPKLPFAIEVNPGETIVCMGAKATAAKLAKLLALHGATRTPPVHTTLGVAISRAGAWTHTFEGDNGLLTISVRRAPELA